MMSHDSDTRDFHVSRVFSLFIRPRHRPLLPLRVIFSYFDAFPRFLYLTRSFYVSIRRTCCLLSTGFLSDVLATISAHLYVEFLSIIGLNIQFAVDFSSPRLFFVYRTFQDFVCVYTAIVTS